MSRAVTALFNTDSRSPVLPGSKGFPLLLKQSFDAILVSVRALYRKSQSKRNRGRAIRRW